MRMRIRTSIEAPRFAGLPRFIKNLAFSHDVVVELEVDKGWITESIRLKAEGEEDKMQRFKTALLAAMQEYNAQ